jgi:hypothetical protein
VLDQWLAKLRAVPYQELAARAGTVSNDEIARDRERSWQVEVEVAWDDKPDGNIRVMVSIDDGGLRDFVPLTGAFTKSPSGELVGE